MTRQQGAGSTINATQAGGSKLDPGQTHRATHATGSKALRVCSLSCFQVLCDMRFVDLDIALRKEHVIAEKAHCQRFKQLKHAGLLLPAQALMAPQHTNSLARHATSFSCQRASSTMHCQAPILLV